MKLPEIPSLRRKVNSLALAVGAVIFLSPALCISGDIGFGEEPPHTRVLSWLASPSDAARRSLASLQSESGASAGQLQPASGIAQNDGRNQDGTSRGFAVGQQLVAALSAESERDRSAPEASVETSRQGTPPSADKGDIITYAIKPRYSYYWDTDDNILNRYGILIGVSKNRWLLTLDSQYTSAKDSLRNSDAALAMLSGYANLTDVFGFGAGVGGVTMKGSSTETSLVGHIKADLNVRSVTVSAYVGREALSDTAALINNNIRYSVLSLSVTQRPVEFLSVTARYGYRDYSDRNFANDMQVTLTTPLLKQPLATAGYSFRYLNFERQTGSGYYDPDTFVSHQVFATLGGESGRLFWFLQPFAGYQAYSRFSERNKEFYGGGIGSLGVKITPKVALELNAEGGNYALGTTTGFGYYLIGFRLDTAL